MSTWLWGRSARCSTASSTTSRTRQNGTLAYINHYDDRSLLGERLVDVAQRAATRARDAPASAHHLMTMTGVAAYYTSAPSADQRAGLRR